MKPLCNSIYRIKLASQDKEMKMIIYWFTAIVTSAIIIELLKRKTSKLIGSNRLKLKLAVL